MTRRATTATFARPDATPPYLRSGASRAADAPPRRGFAAVELAFILPILVVMWLSAVEVIQLLGANRKIEAMANMTGKFVAGSAALTLSDVDGIFDLALAALSPLDPAGTTMTLTAITIDEDGRAVVAWSRVRGAVNAYREGAAINLVVDPAATPPGSQLIMSEVMHSYRPAVAYMLAGLLNIRERKFLTPEIGAVRLCDGTLTDCR